MILRLHPVLQPGAASDRHAMCQHRSYELVGGSFGRPLSQVDRGVAMQLPEVCGGGRMGSRARLGVQGSDSGDDTIHPCRHL